MRRVGRYHDNPRSPTPGHANSADITPHRGEPVLVGGIPATTEDRLVTGHDLDRDRAFVRVHPDHDPLLLLMFHHHVHLLIDTDRSGQEGTAA